LFTDLEASTRLWEEHPDAMKVALARHDEILRDAIDAHAGHVVKATGDGVHAAFATAHDAIDAALDAQRSLSAEPWPETVPLRVRMGIHTGEAQERAGDYFGLGALLGSDERAVAFETGRSLDRRGFTRLLSDAEQRVAEPRESGMLPTN
jgi:class 3 adenylate cyclase